MKDSLHFQGDSEKNVFCDWLGTYGDVECPLD